MNLRLERGEVLVLLGPNGAGKTTTIEILEGFRRRSAGRVSVLGADPIDGDAAWLARLGIVLQSWRDHRGWRVRQLLAHLGRYYAPYAAAERPGPYAVDELIALVGLTARADTVIAKLSGGQRRRLDVAAGLVGRPELLFLDEPTVGFDPQARQDFHDLVRDLSRAGTTILLTTHDLDEAAKLSSRIIILADGRIVAEGTAAELTRRFTGTAEVRYSRRGEFFTHFTPDATGYVRGLFQRYGDEIGDLEVRRAEFVDVYLSLVRDHETGRRADVPTGPTGVRA